MLRRTPDALRAEKTTKLVPKKPGTRVRVRTTDELPPAAATPNEEVIPYKDAVTELREIVARANDNQAKAEAWIERHKANIATGTIMQQRPNWRSAKPR